MVTRIRDAIGGYSVTEVIACRLRKVVVTEFRDDNYEAVLIGGPAPVVEVARCVPTGAMHDNDDGSVLIKNARQVQAHGQVRASPAGKEKRRRTSPGWRIRGGHCLDGKQKQETELTHVHHPVDPKLEKGLRKSSRRPVIGANKNSWLEAEPDIKVVVDTQVLVHVSEITKAVVGQWCTLIGKIANTEPDTRI